MKTLIWKSILSRQKTAASYGFSEKKMIRLSWYKHVPLAFCFKGTSPQLQDCPILSVSEKASSA
jgi:hypothetical protein